MMFNLYFFYLLFCSLCFLFWARLVLVTCVTRLGDFWKFLAKNILQKKPKHIRCLGYFQTNLFLCKNLLWLLFWQLLETICLLFIPASGHTAVVTNSICCHSDTRHWYDIPSAEINVRSSFLQKSFSIQIYFLCPQFLFRGHHRC